MLLTDDEIEKTLDDYSKTDSVALLHTEYAYKDVCIAIAQAQHEKDVKEMVEWGEETCYSHPIVTTGFYGISAIQPRYIHKIRRHCDQCWQALKEDTDCSPPVKPCMDESGFSAGGGTYQACSED